MISPLRNSHAEIAQAKQTNSSTQIINIYKFHILLVRFQIEILCLLTLAPVNTMNPSVKPKQMVGISISELFGEAIV